MRVNGSFNGYNFYNDLWKFTIDTTCVPCASLVVSPIVNLESSDTTFCNKGIVNFTDRSLQYPSTWKWYFQGAVPDTSSDQNPTGIYYGSYGNFDVALKICNSAGCDSIFLPGFITVLQPPATPVISQIGITLFSTPAYSYQWYESGNPLHILSNVSYYATNIPGSYYVMACDSFGCCSPSNMFVITGITDLSSKNKSCVSIPNPTTGKFSISCQNLHPDELEISIYNSLGKKIFTSTEKNTTIVYNREIDISGLSEGVYFIKISSGKFLEYQKVILFK